MPESSPIIVFGCGSQARYAIDNAISTGRKILGLVDLESGSMVGEAVNGAPVSWTLEGALDALDPHAGAAVIAHGDNQLKLRVAKQLGEAGFSFTSVVHGHAIVSPACCIEAGAILNAGAIVLPNALIGAHAIVHSGCVIEHDCKIGVGANIAPGVVLAGRVTVGRASYLYTGCIVAPNVAIGARCVIGAGALVLKDVPENTTVHGVPARAQASKKT